MAKEELKKIVEKDPRYELAAYEFVLEALTYTQEIASPGSSRHISGEELLEGIRELGLHSFGPLAGTVFRIWGITETLDFGNIVFNLVDHGLMGKREQDSIEDFREGFDINEEFWEKYREEPLFQGRQQHA